MCKKGTISERAADKISQGIKQDCGENVQLNEAFISRIYSIFGGVITEVNDEGYFAALTASLPANATRLVNTISQASGTGLTTYLMIQRDLRELPEFPWAVLYVYIPNDFVAYQAASTVIAGNMYYAFRKDLGVATAPHFQELSYACFNIGIKILGDSNLREYRGMPKVVKNKAVIDRIIEAYLSRTLVSIEGRLSNDAGRAGIMNVYNATFPAAEAALLGQRFEQAFVGGINCNLIAPEGAAALPVQGLPPQGNVQQPYMGYNYNPRPQ